MVMAIQPALPSIPNNPENRPVREKYTIDRDPRVYLARSSRQFRLSRDIVIDLVADLNPSLIYRWGYTTRAGTVKQAKGFTM